VLLSAAAGLLVLAGCRSPRGQIELADRTAYATIAATRQAALGKADDFTVASPAEALRERLMETQQLSFQNPASLSSRHAERVRHWPEGVLEAGDAGPPAASAAATNGQPVVLSLVDALQVAARNSRDYQDRKESMFREALTLDLRQYDFSTQWSSSEEVEWTSDESGEESTRTLAADAGLRATRTLQNGALLGAGFSLNFLELLKGGAESTLGLDADASVTLPLLRGAGRHIAREPLTQAERNMLYAVYTYERFKHQFIVGIVDQYLNVLRQLDGVRNAEENYARLRESVERTQAMAEEERLPRIQVDQARQDELRARAGWISAQQGFSSSLDQFKITLGLPPDAAVDLDPEELTRVLQVDTMPNLDALEVPPEGSGVVREPWLDEPAAMAIALQSRLDLKVSAGRVEDAQRQLVIAADRLRPELTLGGSARWSASDESSRFEQTLRDVAEGSRGVYSGLITLDPGLDRTAERNALRGELLAFEAAVRQYQETEDSIKLDILEAIRDLQSARENVVIQRNAVDLAVRRVESTELFLNLERAEVRDLLDAQSDLLDARNAYTSAQVNYRVAFLAFQRDLGLLEVDENGLWTERNYQTLLDDESE
jgi:outer membrane protein TolC